MSNNDGQYDGEARPQQVYDTHAMKTITMKEKCNNREVHDNSENNEMDTSVVAIFANACLPTYFEYRNGNH